jgi:hypothetical protein
MIPTTLRPSMSGWRALISMNEPKPTTRNCIGKPMIASRLCTQGTKTSDTTFDLGSRESPRLADLSVVYPT